MHDQRTANRSLLGKPPKPPYAFVPTKTDLLKILQNLKFEDGPAVRAAGDVAEAATKARRAFERRSKRWRRLRRAEIRAEKKLQRIRNAEYEKRRREISACRTALRLHGVSSELVARIEQLVYGKEED